MTAKLQNCKTVQPNRLKINTMKYTLLLISLVLTTLLYAQGDQSKDNSIDLPVLQQQFADPPVKYRMLQITHQAKMDGTLDSLKKYGYGGVVSNVGFTNYLQDESEWQLFLSYMRRCKELGMDFWLYDEKGYPSGKAGGLTLKDNPEYETMGVVCTRTEGKGTLTLDMPAGPRYDSIPIFVCAAPVKNGLYDFSQQIDLTAISKRNLHELVWTAPDKRDWGILVFHTRRMYEGTHIVTNVSDTNPYINIIDRAAVGRFISVTHNEYKKRAPEEMAGYIHAVFTDEPSLLTSYLKDDERILPAIPWSRSFRDKFREVYGYDIVPVLPFLFEDGGKETVYRRLDFWSFVASLIEENYYGQIQNWCRANGPAASGHALLEEDLYWHAVYEGNLYRDLRRMDLPGLDMLTSDPIALARSTQIPVPKFISSVTHMTQKWENMSETSSYYQGTSNIPVSFKMRLATIGYQYAMGLTRVTSYYGYNDFNDAERRAFNDYIGRLGLVLTQGKHVADVAVYYPIQTMWGSLTPTRKTTWEPPDARRTEITPQYVKSEGLYLTSHIIPYSADLPEAPRVDAAFGEVSRELLASQTDFDYLDDQAITESMIMNNKLKIAGESFGCILLPETRIIPLATYQKIADFVDKGGKLVVFGKFPELGLTPEETNRVISLSDKLKKSGNMNAVTMMSAITPAVKTAVGLDVSLDSPCRELFYNHRGSDLTDIYYLINLSDQPIDREITFRAVGKTESWDPLTGSVKQVSGTIQHDKKTSLKIHLEGFEATIISFTR
jgi:hypothetical protein